MTIPVADKPKNVQRQNALAVLLAIRATAPAHTRTAPSRPCPIDFSIRRLTLSSLPYSLPPHSTWENNGEETLGLVSTARMERPLSEVGALRAQRPGPSSPHLATYSPQHFLICLFNLSQVLPKPI